MNHRHPVPGQRWVSDSEPELGLGIITRVETSRVEIQFPAANEQRLYALSSSPLRRVAFKASDRITIHGGVELVVEGVREHDGLLVYETAVREVIEAELSDAISFSSPEERLLAGHVDEAATFKLRAEALAWRSRLQQSSVRGYIGGRIDLIPHQLSIAGEVASRLVPRVLLADEVGLGKTIEAGLIVHRLHLVGRADRVLILVPEPLVHQWFVEMLRRFNLPFNIYDEERCEALEMDDENTNPFLDAQLILCSVGLLANDARRAAQAMEAGWNLLVVDEAHHLEWTQQGSGTSYRVVESLAVRTPGLLLLTATPQQLGPEGHFARLRLLDPERYSDLARFLAEADQYEIVAKAVDRIAANQPLLPSDNEFVASQSSRVRKRVEEYAAGHPGAGERLIADLLDSFGTGRVMFRNTRAALSGFPERKAHLTALDPSQLDDDVQSGSLATHATLAMKVRWLADLLRELRDEKVLLICRTRSLAEQVHERLQHESRVNSALFHEGLTLVQRDRNAAYFAEHDGARILISSEIGSEGRNFQFAHHLVLFDLPTDPELLEQRIGRLDRIGQNATVNIHVPYLPSTDSEVLARWYHEGLNAFEENLHGAAEIAEALFADLRDLLAEFDAGKLQALIARSREEQKRVESKLEHGYDRLLQLNSNKPERADEIARLIRAADNSRDFEAFFIRLLDFFGVHVEELASRTYLFRPDHLLTDEFPELPDDGISATFDRTRSLSREEIEFMSWDHPFVRSVMDVMLGSERGNASFGIWKGRGDEGLFLELNAVVECVAPPSLHVDRFLSPTPIRVAVDSEREDATGDAELASAQLRDGDVARVLNRVAVKTALIPSMLDTALDIATREMETIVSRAQKTMGAQLQHEIERLEDLHQINSNVDVEEIESMRDHRSALHSAITSARLRVEALRLILRVP